MRRSPTDSAARFADARTAAHVAPSASAELETAAVVLGEVHTCLLQNREPLSTPATEALMRLTPGAPVSRVERPVRRVVSAPQVVGVDCRLRVAREGHGRAVGTVLSHAIVTGGRVLQGAARVTLTPAPAPDPATRVRRREWQYYLRRPGHVEVIGSAAPIDTLDGFLDGFLTDSRPATGLDLASICSRVIAGVQAGALLDHVTALRAGTGVLRWAADLHPGHDGPRMSIVKSDGAAGHLIRFQGRPSDLPTVSRFCEDFARHEWLLSTVQDSILSRAERADAGTELPAFALSQLVPLWMPPTFLSPQMKELWLALEHRTNYSLVFQQQTNRLRDLLHQRGRT